MLVQRKQRQENPVHWGTQLRKWWLNHTPPYFWDRLCPLSSGIYLSLRPQPEDTGRCCCTWLLCGSWNLSSGPHIFMARTFLKAAWCSLPVMLALWRPKQEECHKFKAKLTYEFSQSNAIMPLSQKMRRKTSWHAEASSCLGSWPCWTFMCP